MVVKQKGARTKSSVAHLRTWPGRFPSLKCNLEGVEWWSCVRLRRCHQRAESTKVPCHASGIFLSSQAFKPHVHPRSNIQSFETNQGYIRKMST
jgi:hypothetical protein